ncbi:PilZ domain-containing protein [Sphingomonas sp. M1-B02]|uniref:PilZ domain-containing protein n=1 Tax=Sphingomonas sp. M1-B02 TaxID=3114300 RepID=UPI00223EC118|nr:PilZ domain-containing protein [Sphingomonas sp. S6-11]UZK66560.1 PilZ domain-containing protein [Sphingomonas sp. S6-11]
MEQFSPDPLSALSADDFTGQRSGSRDSLMLTAQFRVDDGEIEQVRVRNLSSGGLMADYTAPITPKTPVQIEVRGIGWLRGRVAWTAEGRIGVAFDNDIDPMLARKPVGKGGHTPHYAKAIVPRR